MKAEKCAHCGHFKHHHTQGTGICMQWLETGFLCYCEEFKEEPPEKNATGWAFPTRFGVPSK